jgi:hypothetical protein
MSAKFVTDTFNFEEIIKDGYVYVDKTEHIFYIINNHSRIFLARPRRFGKSLLVSTIENIFLGKKELFDNLWLARSGYQFPEHSVLRLDFSLIKSKNISNFNEKFVYFLKNTGLKYGINVNGNEYDICTIDLITKLNSLPNKNKVVILIDEYDYPLLLPKLSADIQEEITELLHDFYVTLKGLENAIHLIFVTGVTQLARTALGQSTSNLSDISLVDEASCICGFTIDELDRYYQYYYHNALKNAIFKKYLHSEATVDDLRELILSWYDGYNFSPTPENKTNVLNPISINKFFRYSDLIGYWVKDGPPHFLAEQIALEPNVYLDLLIKGNHNTDESYQDIQTLTSLEIENPAPLPLLFQTGFLTINNGFYTLEDGHAKLKLSLKIPNFEVSQAWKSSLYRGLFAKKFGKDINKLKIDIKTAIYNKDEIEFSKISSKALSILTSYEHGPEIQYEGKYQGLLHIFFYGVQFNINGEVNSAHGRSDLEIELDHQTRVVIEVKQYTSKSEMTSEKISIELEKLAKIALQQIEETKYGGHGEYPAKKLIKIGLAVTQRDNVKALFA